ncbi:46402_t:CDS:1, partial [Gigaspora margarita]
TENETETLNLECLVLELSHRSQEMIKNYFLAHAKDNVDDNESTEPLTEPPNSKLVHIKKMRDHTLYDYTQKL